MDILKCIAVFVLSLACVCAVNRPPSVFIQPPNDVYYKPGETVELPCIADGIPKPIYKWQFNGLVFNPSGQDDRVVQLPNQGTIVFNRPEDKDEGIYQCFAINNYGTSISIKVNLRVAKLGQFAPEPRKTFRVQSGMALTLNCVPPLSYPKADVYWVVKETDGRWTAINYDSRMSMDIEGRLRITNVIPADRRDGKAYTCMAINYFMRDNAIGPENVIEITGTSELRIPAYELWTSPSNQFFLAGSDMKIKCIFGGNPTPKVYWSKVNGTLPDRSSIKSFGQELWITNVQLSDQGNYECEGMNLEAAQRATKSIYISVESVPTWVKEPKDAEVGTGESATFICTATGIPAPEYSWYIDGIRLQDVRDPRIFGNQHFQKPNNNNITFVNLTLDYHMNIQCNASNKHGYVFSDVYLNVLAEAPTIIEPPPPMLKVAEGKTVNITCKTSGKPDPLITWYRGSSLITGGRYTIQDSGSLTIENVVLADAGIYLCQASNMYKSNVTSTACELQVKRRTRIENFPMDLEVIAGNEGKFTCSGSTDTDEVGNLVVSWEKDGKEISTEDQRMSQNFMDNSLTISGTIVRDSGVYTCIISNGLDEARAAAILTVKDKPDSPTGVEITRCRDKSADIKWIKGMDNNAPVNYFVVQFNTTFNKDQWISIYQAKANENTATVPLSPWANYTFRVIATNKIGQSAPSFQTPTVCRTNPARPERNPVNVKSIGDSRGFLKLEWTPMTQIEHNGEGFQYILTIKERGTTQPQVYNIPQWTTSRFNVSIPNKIYTPYLVTLKGKNNVGESMQDPVEYLLYSFEEIPKVRVFEIGVSEMGSTTAKLQWNWDSAWLTETGRMRDIQGELKGFKISFWVVNEKVSTFREVDVLVDEIIQPGQRLKRSTQTAIYTLENLPAFNQIECTISVMNNFYVGPPSEIVTIRTAEGVPGPVLNFEARVRSSNAFMLDWNLPSTADLNGILTGFDIAFQTVDGLLLGAIHDREEQLNDPYVTEAVLNGLLPNRKYRVYIWARTRNGRGESTFIEAMTTMIAPPGAPSFSVLFVTETMINLTWTPGSSAGGRTVFYAEYRREGEADWLQTTDEVLYNWKNITGLQSGTAYEVRVVAFDGENRVSSETKIVNTLGTASAFALIANWKWFLGMLVAVIIIITCGVVIWIIHKKRRNVTHEPPKPSFSREDARLKKSDPNVDRESAGQYNDYIRGESFDDLKKQPPEYDDFDRKREPYPGPKGSSDPKRYSDARRYSDYDDDDEVDEGGFQRHSRDYDNRYSDEDDDRYSDRFDDDLKGRSRYDRPPSYDRTPSYEKRPPSETDSYQGPYEDYQREPTKFDDEGQPVDTKPASAKAASTFV
ncbi:hypothetical protein ACJMK2_016641 [Sinanodonta woodiana]|uniref:Neuroglian n=1 Tax=Sinanodonta woodiana TaxID=1069815 RepID=A0ABD3UVM2_SINWO